MKLCHAAAFALVGWYLVVPDVIPHTHQPDLSKPASKWAPYGPFSSQIECEDRLQRMIAHGDRPDFWRE
jgi:hypothetical protein